MHNDSPICMRAIGLVETDVADADIARQRRTMVSDIVLFDDYVAGLKGITEYSHIIVIFWMHHAVPSAELIVHPRGDTSLPPSGVFAARGRGRPNPIGLAVTELIKLEGPRLTVRRLDAYNATPIIDIKPYDRYDIYTAIRMPKWFDEHRRPSPKRPPGSGS